MLLVALLLRPWMSHMTSMGSTPRTLADDLLTTAAGPDHANLTISAVNATHTYLQNMGSRVATTKSVLFASTEDGKKTLSKYSWPYANDVISVLAMYLALLSRLRSTHASRLPSA